MVNIGSGWYTMSSENIGLFRSMKEVKVHKCVLYPKGKRLNYSSFNWNKKIKLSDNLQSVLSLDIHGVSINVVLDEKLPDIWGGGAESLLTWNDGGKIVDDKKLHSYLIFVKPREIQVIYIHTITLLSTL